MTVFPKQSYCHHDTKHCLQTVFAFVESYVNQAGRYRLLLNPSWCDTSNNDAFRARIAMKWSAREAKRVMSFGQYDALTLSSRSITRRYIMTLVGDIENASLVQIDTS